ncbi:MAG: hypothetical protein AAF242_16850, partial [Bacteroidota bacterium]
MLFILSRAETYGQVSYVANSAEVSTRTNFDDFSFTTQFDPSTANFIVVAVAHRRGGNNRDIDKIELKGDAAANMSFDENFTRLGFARNSSTNNYAELWYISPQQADLTNANAGDYQIVVDQIGSGSHEGIVVVSANFSGVDVSALPGSAFNPLNGVTALGNDSNDKPEITVNSVQTGELVIDVFSMEKSDANITTDNSGQDDLARESVGNMYGGVSIDDSRTGNVNMSWTTQSSGLWAGMAVALKPAATTPMPTATNDNAANLIPGQAHTINILSNDQLDDNSTPTAPPAGAFEIDIDQSTNGTQTTLNVTNEGSWSYNTNNGELTFTPLATFGGDPTPLVYTLIEGAGSDNATVTLDYDAFDLSLTKTLLAQTDSEDFNDDGVNLYSPGEQLTFELTITNSGDIDATDIQIVDYFPSDLFVVSSGWTVVGNIATRNTTLAVAAGGSETIEIGFQINGSFTGSSLENRAEIAAANDVGNNNPTDIDSTPDNINGESCSGVGDEDDHACATVNSGQTFDLALRKEFEGLQVDNNGNGLRENTDVIRFKFTVLNQGTLDATNIDVTDYIPTEYGSPSVVNTSVTSFLGNSVTVTDQLSGMNKFTL